MVSSGVSMQVNQKSFPQNAWLIGVCTRGCQPNTASFGRLIFYCSPQNHVSLIYYWKVTAQKATWVSQGRFLLMPAAGAEGIRSSIQLQKLISQNSVNSCMASLRWGLATQRWSKHSSCWKHLMVCWPICSRWYEDFESLMSNFCLTIPRQDIEPSWRPFSTLSKHDKPNSFSCIQFISGWGNWSIKFGNLSEGVTHYSCHEEKNTLLFFSFKFFHFVFAKWLRS